MSISIRNRVVVFDYGEVISRSPSESDRSVLLAIADTPAVAFWDSYWSHRDGLDAGTMSVFEYWQLVASDLGRQWAPATVHELWIADFRSWWSVESGTLELIDALHTGGTRMAILSNAGFDFASGFRFSPLGHYFERVFVSAEMNLIKPDPAIYREVAGELGIALGEMVFIDNKAINADAAAALGITAHHFTNVDRLAAFLHELAWDGDVLLGES